MNLYLNGPSFLNLCTSSRDNGCATVNDMMATAQELQSQLLNPSVCPLASLLVPILFLVGSVAEGSRTGFVQELDMMMSLSGFKESFLATTTSPSRLKLSEQGQNFFRKYFILVIVKVK